MYPTGTMNDTLDPARNGAGQMRRYRELKRIAELARATAGACDEYLLSSSWQAVGVTEQTGDAISYLPSIGH